MDEVIKTQKLFQQMLKNDITTQEFKTTCVMGLLEESMEALKETPFKKHKKNQKFNRLNFINELVDVQLYLLNLLLSCDVTWEEFRLDIERKQQINFDRQKNNY